MTVGAMSTSLRGEPHPAALASGAGRFMASEAAPRPAARATAEASGRPACGFARVFATADGERVMVAARDERQFADLAEAARLTGTFAFLERVLQADFSDVQDLYTHRHTITTMLSAWFGWRTVAELAAAFAGTSVTWRVHPMPPPGRGGDRVMRPLRLARFASAQELSAVVPGLPKAPSERTCRSAARLARRDSGVSQCVTIAGRAGSVSDWIAV